LSQPVPSLEGDRAAGRQVDAGHRHVGELLRFHRHRRCLRRRLLGKILFRRISPDEAEKDGENSQD